MRLIQTLLQSRSSDLKKLPYLRYSTEASASSSGSQTSNLTVTNTVDANEVKKFQVLSDQWWNRNGEMQVLQNMNKLRVPFIRDGLINTGLCNLEHQDTDKPLKGLKILDVGCGGGFLSEPLARLGAETTGIDATKELIEVAKAHMKKDKSLSALSYYHTTIEEFSQNNKQYFDAVVSSEVVEHVITKNTFLGHCAQCIKPGGSIFLTTVSQTPAARLLVIFMAENVLNIVPKGTHEFEKFICPHNLQRILEECNCTTRRIHGLTLNPVSKEWCWIPYTDVNYALHAVKNK